MDNSFIIGLMAGGFLVFIFMAFVINSVSNEWSKSYMKTSLDWKELLEKTVEEYKELVQDWTYMSNAWEDKCNYWKEEYEVLKTLHLKYLGYEKK